MRALSSFSLAAGICGLVIAADLAYGGIAPVDSPEFWFAMQIAMLAGYCTSYPANWLLIRAGVREAM